MQFSFSGSDFWLGVENNVTAFKHNLICIWWWTTEVKNTLMRLETEFKNILKKSGNWRITSWRYERDYKHAAFFPHTVLCSGISSLESESSTSQWRVVHEWVDSFSCSLAQRRFSAIWRTNACRNICKREPKESILIVNRVKSTDSLNGSQH